MSRDDREQIDLLAQRSVDLAGLLARAGRVAGKEETSGAVGMMLFGLADEARSIAVEIERIQGKRAKK